MNKFEIYSDFKNNITSHYFSPYALINELNDTKKSLGVTFTKELMIEILYQNIQVDNNRELNKKISKDSFINSKMMRSEINYLKKDPKTQKNIESIENFTEGFELKKEIIPQKAPSPEVVFQQKQELSAFLKNPSPENTLNITKK